MLNALRVKNRTLTTLIAEQNRFSVSRALLAFIGNLVCFENNTLQRLQLASNRSHCLLKRERSYEINLEQTQENSGFSIEDTQMLAWFKREVAQKSNIKLITI